MTALDFYRREVEPRLTRDVVYGAEDLKWRGDRGVGACPLHGGDNPHGFVVFGDSLVWKCSTGGCATAHGKVKGNALDFVRFRHGLDLGGAVAWLASALGDDLKLPAPPPRQRIERQKAPPLPAGEAEALWNRCVPITEDPLAVAWLVAAGHRLDPARIEDLDLARVVPYGFDLPSWAAHWRRQDRRGIDVAQYRLAFPTFDATGAMVSLRARTLRRPLMRGVLPGGMQKASAPAYFAAAGVLAEVLGQRMLRGEADAGELVRDAGLWIVEGERDFLIIATSFGESDVAPAVLGVLGWTQGHADRVPDGTAVVVASHQDDQGQVYAAGVWETFAARAQSGAVRLERWAP